MTGRGDGGLSSVGLDVLCTKIAVDFQTMTAASAAECIAANLELLREATRADAAFHASFDAEATAFLDVQVARGLLAAGNPEQLRGQSLERSRGSSRGSPRCGYRRCAIRATRGPTRPRTRRCGRTSASARC